MLERMLLWKASVKIPKPFRKLGFILLWKSCTKRYADYMKLSRLILSLQNRKPFQLTAVTISMKCILFFFMASFLEPRHWNLKFSIRIVWFTVIKEQ